jgi:hypothetical protein
MNRYGSKCPRCANGLMILRREHPIWLKLGHCGSGRECDQVRTKERGRRLGRPLRWELDTGGMHPTTSLPPAVIVSREILWWLQEFTAIQDKLGR